MLVRLPPSHAWPWASEGRCPPRSHEDSPVCWWSPGHFLERRWSFNTGIIPGHMQLTQTIHHCVCSAPGTGIPQRERTRILLVLPKNLGFKPRFVDRSMPNTTHSA